MLILTVTDEILLRDLIHFLDLATLNSLLVTEKFSTFTELGMDKM
jgi:hypothetical protein